MKTRFYLTRPNAKEETAIYCLCNFRYSELTETGIQYRPTKIYTGISIEPKHWNKAKNEVRGTHPNHPELNQSLKNITADLTKLYTDLRNEGKEVTPELFKQEWDKIANPTPKPKKTEFPQFIEQFIERAKADRTLTTISVYRNTFNHLQNFAEYKGIELTFDGITLDFGLDLQQYLKTELQFQPNTIWKVIKTLKTFMNESLDRKLHNNKDFLSKRFSVPQIETPSIFLNENELQTLWETDFSNDKKLEKVRDLFLVGCYTGLRFSDLSKLTTNNIIEFEGEKMLSVLTQKTGKPVSIPLHYQVENIIAKYGGTLPKAISNQRFNEYLKEIGKETGLTDTITIEETKGNLKTPKTYQKWQLLTTHTARRSFATNMFLAGIDPLQIMKITGHRTMASFMTYLKLEGKENALTIANSKFFKKPQLKVAK